MERLLPRFRAAHSQVLGVSVDSVFSHANWGKSLGGVSFPLLADFQPKGGLASRLGVYLDEPGITDRATIVIDAQGVVRHASSVTPAGRRKPEELAALCESVDAEHGRGLPDFPAPAGLEPGARLFVKNGCGFSRAVMIARDNLHLGDGDLPLLNVSDSAPARDELVKLAGKDQAPALCSPDRALHESADIIKHLVDRCTDWPG